MREGLLRRSVLLLVAGVLLAACADNPVAPYPISNPPSYDQVARFGVGDTFEVLVYAESDLSGPKTVPPGGEINFPLIGKVKVLGRTPMEVQDEIQARLKDGYLVNPSVEVKVTEYKSKKVTVFGAVKAPGTLAYTDSMSILEAITKVGGFTSLARKNAVRVTRHEADGKVQRYYVAVQDIAKGKAPNFYLRPGDTILVDERSY